MAVFRETAIDELVSNSLLRKSDLIVIDALSNISVVRSSKYLFKSDYLNLLLSSSSIISKLLLLSIVGNYFNSEIYSYLLILTFLRSDFSIFLKV